ncbi:hypothetical protein VUJ46_07800 [Chryseobacterium sp. MYb264]|uniref:hypothetical protein n=1 Tax=Chryseobacterium sp. MYb264 TaxID=2745153 RepID=UPI002E110A8A|nr:hypothetical protein VUJ46_07800 [Chryseobacterium sp. MYb264]
MIKKILLGTFCIVQFSLASANVINENPVSTVNYQKERVPKSVIIKTKKFKIKIDQQPNGNYLYQSWGVNGKVSTKPAMIISNGNLIPDGSGGNYYYEFDNNGYTYQVWRNYLTASAKTPAYTLVVIDQNGKTIVNQDGIVVKN